MNRNNYWLVVGLGNPGTVRSKDRHNVGFMVVEDWISSHESENWFPRFSGRLHQSKNSIYFLEPLASINLSGESVKEALDTLRVSLDKVIIIHDDIDLPLGKITLKFGGGSSHNGVRDIVHRIGTEKFMRLRVGVGRPQNGPVLDWVLSPFSEDISEVVSKGSQALSRLFEVGFSKAMNEINRR